MTSSNEEVYILSAVRTAIGGFAGAFQRTSATQLGSTVIREAVRVAGISANDVDEVVMGQVLTAGQGQNVARQSAVLAELPYSVTASTVNMVCGSGLKAVYNGYTTVRCREAEVVVCGGQENMSRAEYTTHVRGSKLGNTEFKDTILCDGLTCAFENVHMGETAEYLANKHAVTRKEQDEYAVNSQKKAEIAIKAGYFEKEIIPVMVKQNGPLIAVDEHPRFQTDLSKLLALVPCFVKRDSPYAGTVTPGNASGLNDGAAAVVICSGRFLKTKNLSPIAKIIGFAQAGVEPMDMGLAPVEAVTKLLAKVGWNKDEVDLFELNEAFAVQAKLVQDHLGVPETKININGGAVALGHPLGASGARVLVTLIHSLRRLNLVKGVAALCIGGGMGIAVAVEAIASTPAVEKIDD